MLEAEILKQETLIRSKDQREQFFEEGFLVIEDVIQDDWLKRLRAAMTEVIDASRSVTESNGKYVLEGGHGPDDPRLRRLNSPVSHHPTFWDFASTSQIVKVAADVCGPDVKFYHSKLNFKWPKGGHLFDWHQDIPAWPHTDYSPVTIGLHIDDCASDQGPLIAIKGSHKEELRSMYDKDGNWVLRIDEENLPSNWAADAVEMTGPAGSLALLNCRVIHGSKSNASAAYLMADHMPASALPCD